MRLTRTATRLAAVTLLAVAVGLLPGTAARATHDEDCPAYSAPNAPVDEVGVGAAVIATSGITRELDLAAEILEEGRPVTEAPHKIARVVAGVASGIDFAFKAALHALQITNKIADECRIDAHYRMLDDVLSSQIRRDLAAPSSAPPVALFVLPEEYGGYLDTKGVGTQAVVQDAIKRMKARGQCSCGSAESAYASAVSAMGAGQYKNAYRLFRQAYVNAVSG